METPAEVTRNQTRKGGVAKRYRTDEWLTDHRLTENLNNVAFEKYYRGAIVPEEEWETFISTMRSSLPMSFRVNVSLPNAAEVFAYLRTQLETTFETTMISFFPNSLALQCDVSRGDLKRNVKFKTLKKIIAAFNNGGYLTRQEAVSMIPPLLLHVEPGQKVLDMCAAPGSKTSQILEIIAQDPNRGVVVANDVSTSRLDVLHHQTNRCTGAQAHLIITNYDASRFPLAEKEEDKFDRVLCDVVCSGDGTLRKSIDMWPRWNTVQGADLHNVQMRILTRGMMLCKKGGFVVYSTCSLNPLEDEAVLSECIRQSKGSFRLVDPMPWVADLKASDGRTEWTIVTKDLSTRLSTHAEAVSYQQSVAESTGNKGKRGFTYRQSMFSDTPQLTEQKIHYAKRIFPHLQNTGGFFVAVMECVEDYPNSLASQAGERPLPPSPFHVLPEELRPVVSNALGIPQDKFPMDHIFLRNDTAREQKMYYVTPDTAALLRSVGPRVVSVGSKIFEAYSKSSNERLRYSIDGACQLALLLSDLPSHIVVVEPEHFLELCNGVGLIESVFLARIGKSAADLPRHSFLVACDMTVVGRVYATAERILNTGALTMKSPDWQRVLANLTLGNPLAKDDADDKENDGDDDGDDENGSGDAVDKTEEADANHNNEKQPASV